VAAVLVVAVDMYMFGFLVGFRSAFLVGFLPIILSLSISRTCLCTIHQPSPQIFELLDKVVLLSAGKLIYFGPAKNVESYFSQDSVGYMYDGRENPAEFILNIASGRVKPKSAINARSAEELEAVYNRSFLRETYYSSKPSAIAVIQYNCIP